MSLLLLPGQGGTQQRQGLACRHVEVGSSRAVCTHIQKCCQAATIDGAARLRLDGGAYRGAW